MHRWTWISEKQRLFWYMSPVLHSFVHIWWQWKSQLCSGPFLKPGGGLEIPSCNLASHLALADMGGVGPVDFVVFGYCLKVLCLDRLPLAWSFPYREADFVRAFFVCTHWSFWVASLSSTQSGICEAKRKPGELTSWGPEVSTGSAFSPSFRVLWFFNI